MAAQEKRPAPDMEERALAEREKRPTPDTQERTLADREERYLRRLAELEQRENALKQREEALAAAEQEKKQVLLRIPLSLWLSLARWADQDLRSINGQIEYLLTRAVREKNKGQ